MKKVRMLLRVSSNQQLEADGDLSVQREILIDFIKRQPDWTLDEKEYFEGSKSAYKNTASQRDVLQEILQDAEKKEFDILVLYKDDRVGRLMWDTPQYIMSLKKFGVDVVSAKDGCITPELNDITGQIVLAIRYGNAQKSSVDTSMRVKDTAQKLVQKGKFMGGKSPYGYTLEYSGEISKHGRALKHLVIAPEQAKVVQHIYDLSLNKEFGSQKIASILNNDDDYKHTAPNQYWKGGTITSILTNPIYAGFTAYKRRESSGGKVHRLSSEDWIIAEEQNTEIAIIDIDIWNKVQEKRKRRVNEYTHSLDEQDITVITRNDGGLPLIDVAYCGYCGKKLTNGTKYSYWTIKDTGEKRASKTPAYKCQNAWQGVPHDKNKQFRADVIEKVVFSTISEYIAKLQENDDIFDEIQKNLITDKRQTEKELKKKRTKLKKIKDKISVMEDNLPEAMMGNYIIPLEQLYQLILAQKANYTALLADIDAKESELKETAVSIKEWDFIRKKINSWEDVFINSDSASKRVLVNRLVERIDIKKDEIKIRFRINLNDFFTQPRMSGGLAVPKQGV